MSKNKKVIVFNSILRESYKMEQPPYYYPSTNEFTEDNLQEIKNEICNQIQDILKLEGINKLKLKEFVNNINEDKKKLEFDQFILRIYIVENKIHQCIDTNTTL